MKPKSNQKSHTKRAIANIETMRKIFTLPEDQDATLLQLDKEISENLLGFLGERIVTGDIAPSNLEQDFNETRIPEDPLFVKEQVQFLLDKVVAQSVHTSSPSFIGHMTSALPYFMLPLSKIMTTLNQNVVKIETSKAFTPLERQVIGMLHRLAYQKEDQFYEEWTQNFSHSLGSLCSGGTIANMTALWVARNRLFAPRGNFPGIAEAGMMKAFKEYGFEDLVLLVSERGHYSIKKAADLLGLGKQQVVLISTDHQHKMQLHALEKQLKRARQSNAAVLAVVGIAGTTETGNIDPLLGISQLAKEYEVHFHVDAAWGGPTLFSRSHHQLLDGIAEADSITIDAHKQLYTPIGAGLALFREPYYLDSIEQRANYIIRPGSRDIGKHSLEGSRNGMAMLIHSGLRIIGKRGYELLIDEGINKAKTFAAMIEKTPDFELISHPELNLLTYRYVPESLQEKLRRSEQSPNIQYIEAINNFLNELTEFIQKTQRSYGKTFVSRTAFPVHRYDQQKLTVLRVVLANPLTTTQILENILNEQRTIAQDLLKTTLNDAFQAL